MLTLFDMMTQACIQFWDLLETLFLGPRIQSYHLAPGCTFWQFSFYFLFGPFDKPFLTAMLKWGDTKIRGNCSQGPSLASSWFRTSSSFMDHTLILKCGKKPHRNVGNTEERYMMMLWREIQDETMRTALVTKSSLLGLQAPHCIFPAHVCHTLSWKPYLK